MLAASMLAASLFAVQNSFWVNLHQFLHAEAVRQRMRQPVAFAVADLADAERRDWTAALDAYRDLSRRNLVFDAQLVAINDALARAGDPARLEAAAIDAAVVGALNRAAPVYRARLWPRHREINDTWIRRIQTAIEQHAARL